MTYLVQDEILIDFPLYPSSSEVLELSDIYPLFQ
jgi:hypothetical protein